MRRIGGLFTPHKAALVVTVILVLVGAALSVIPPLLTQRAFDDGLFPPSGAARHAGAGRDRGRR